MLRVLKKSASIWFEKTHLFIVHSLLVVMVGLMSTSLWTMVDTYVDLPDTPISLIPSPSTIFITGHTNSMVRRRLGCWDDISFNSPGIDEHSGSPDNQQPTECERKTFSWQGVRMGKSWWLCIPKGSYDLIRSSNVHNSIYFLRFFLIPYPSQLFCLGDWLKKVRNGERKNVVG